MIELVDHLGRHPLSFGTGDLGNHFREMSDEMAWSILEAAWDGGIRSYDTAPHYGLGLAERRLGEFLQTKPRDSYVLSTKAGRLLRPNPGGEDRQDDEHFAVPATTRRVWDPTPAGVRASLEESLERLGLDRVDILYVHDPQNYDLEQGIAVGLPACAELRDEGLVDAVGVGSGSLPALEAAARTGIPDLLMAAGRYTLLEQPLAAEVIPECRRHGIGIACASVFNSGLLASDSVPTEAYYDYAPAPPEMIARAQRLAAVCADHGVHLPTAALHFPLREPLVRTVVTSAMQPDQIGATIARMAEPVPDELWAHLAAEGLIP
ncbi:MAG TPA: aldo/keto reductase [Propionibacteriaceae bacterium]|nr:aldo/keto reductase [Propionibacteriaceae bacterium]